MKYMTAVEKRKADKRKEDEEITETTTTESRLNQTPIREHIPEEEHGTAWDPYGRTPLPGPGKLGVDSYSRKRNINRSVVRAYC